MNTQKQNKEYWLNLIIDKLTGSISDEALCQLKEWQAASDENRLYVENLSKLWESLDLVKEEEQINSERAYLLFKERIREEEQGICTKPALQKHLSFKLFIRITAVLIPFIFLSYFSFRYYELQYGEKKTPLVSEVVVPNGSKTKLTLQDGSTVWLNAGSEIQYDSDFGKVNRRLKLTGEAYLEVAKNKECPFIVDAGDVKIKVLGTHFNINAYADNNEIQVALLEGSIEMETSNDKLFKLKPKDIAHFNTVSKETEIHHNKECSENTIGWIENRLIFNGESFEQISNALERSFNVKINIHKETIKNRHFIGDFVNNETIEQIFNVMSSDGKFKYKIKGNVIDVY